MYLMNVIPETCYVH